GAIDGAQNFALISGVVGAVLLSGLWDPGIVFDVLGTPLALQNVVRDGALAALAVASLVLTPREVRASNAFSWAPIVEVAKLFAGIFFTIIPLLAILQAGRDGPLGNLVALVTDNMTGEPRHAMYFWMTGLLSALLEHSPTYLVVCHHAG